MKRKVEIFYNDVSERKEMRVDGKRVETKARLYEVESWLEALLEALGVCACVTYKHVGTDELADI